MWLDVLKDIALWEKSTYVNFVNVMLESAEEGANLYVSENGISLYKLLHHRDSDFEELVNAKNLGVKIFTWRTGRKTEGVLSELSRKNWSVFILS